MEYLNLYDKYGNLTKEKGIRGVKSDKLVGIVIIFIENSNGEFLIQKTSSSRNSIFATTGGHVSFGSSFEDAVINEDLVKGLKKLLISTGGGNVNRSFTTNNQRIVAAVCSRPFSSMIDKNGFNISSSFKMQRMSITGLDGKAVNYFVFVNDASTVSNFDITFKL